MSFRIVSIAAILGVWAAGARAGVVTVPYRNDFSASVADFAETSDAQWSLVAGAYRNSDTAADQGSIAAVQVPTLGGPAADAGVQGPRSALAKCL